MIGPDDRDTAERGVAPQRSSESRRPVDAARPQSEAAAAGLQPFRLLTWNTLAPVYFREGRGRSLTEADLPKAFQARHARICAAIAASDADIVCLQEHWFEPVLMGLYKERLGAAGYRYESLQRTAWNCEGRTEDGIAMLVRERSFRLVRRHDVRFQDHGIPQDRVALLLELCDDRAARDGPALAVLCTHLTYPHSRYDMESRKHQIFACLKAAERQVPPGTPLVVAGDLNGPSTDSVSNHLRGAGFRNVWEDLHGRPCQITHMDHRGNNFASDHIWIRGSLAPRAASLLPEGAPDSTSLLRPTIGAASSGQAAPASFADWCQLSDHRPLVATLSWDP